ncbi:MAG: DnaJ C-terminal domain-containing protein [Pseudomarimonas sp.]
MQFKDYYDILGVKPEASEAEIKTAYRRLARKFHPDVSKEAGAEERFKTINEAYEALKDPERRAAYDQLKARGFRAGQEYQPGHGQPGYGFDPREGFSGGDGASGFSDFFESLFGRSRQSERGPTFAAGRDQQATIKVDLDVVFNGGMQRVRIDDRTLEVRIPRGIAPGQQIRLAKQGRGGADLRLEIAYRPHPQFKLDGRDLHYLLPITPWEAALGAEIGVPTMAGTVQLKIPAGSDSGKRLRLRGRGMPEGGQAQNSGDQIVELSVRVPPASTDEQREWYRKMAELFPFAPRTA